MKRSSESLSRHIWWREVQVEIHVCNYISDRNLPVTYQGIMLHLDNVKDVMLRHIGSPLKLWLFYPISTPPRDSFHSMNSPSSNDSSSRIGCSLILRRWKSPQREYPSNTTIVYPRGEAEKSKEMWWMGWRHYPSSATICCIYYY